MALTMTVDVTFGDCDPAGIAFYPNIFRWMDAGFQRLLRPLGGHARVNRTFGSIGLGLVDAQAQFRSPIRDGDQLALQVCVAEWSSRSLTLRYEGRVGDRLAFEGREIRCLFIPAKDGIVAGELDAFRAMLEKAE